MTTANNNWRQGNNERRVNLAMTAEMALGGGAAAIGQQKSSNFNNGGGVPRLRGDMKAGGTNDILESYMPSSHSKPTQGGIIGGGNTYAFGSEKLTDGIGNWQQPSRAYNTGNDFGGVGGGFGALSNGYATQQFSGNNNNTNNIMNGDSSGFKVQRVRGGGNAGTSSIPQQQQQQYPTGLGNGLNNIGQQPSTQGLGAGMQRGSNRKDENTDIDFQTRQIKKEIDSLDQKLSSKQYGGAEQTHSPITMNKGGIGSTFGGQNNINTGNNALNGGFGHPNNQIHGSSGHGSNNNTNNNFNNFYSSLDKTPVPFNGTPSTNSTVNSQTPSSGSGSTRQSQKPSSKEGFDDPLDLVKKTPANNSNTFASTSMSSKHIPTENNLAVAKEFSTGTYDPSNIVGGNRQGRMRSMGKNKAENKNQHEEKAAQATGTKLLPEQQLVSMEQFTCPEGCGRSFNKTALEKHIPYCKKLFQQKKPSEAPTGAVANKKAQNENENNQQTAQKQQLKPPKGKKETKPAAENTAKTEAIRKMKEQKKKEMEEMKRKESQKEGQHDAGQDEDDGGVINDAHDGEYL